MTIKHIDSVFAELRVAVIGLGYVGLPLAVAFGHRRDVIGLIWTQYVLVSYRMASIRRVKLLNMIYLVVSTPHSLAIPFIWLIATVTSSMVSITEHKKPDLDPLIQSYRISLVLFK